MHIEHHDLHHEFPEMHDAISTLRSANPMFARMYATYHRLTGKVEIWKSTICPSMISRLRT